MSSAKFYEYYIVDLHVTLNETILFKSEPADLERFTWINKKKSSQILNLSNQNFQKYFHNIPVEYGSCLCKCIQI